MEESEEFERDQLSLFWLEGLERAVDLTFAIEQGRLEALETYLRDNQWVHPLVGEVILRLLEGSHGAYRLDWGRSRKLKPTELSPFEALCRDDYLAQEVRARGGFDRGMYGRVCHEVGAEVKPPLAGITVQRRVRRFRPKAKKSET